MNSFFANEKLNKMIDEGRRAEIRQEIDAQRLGEAVQATTINHQPEMQSDQATTRPAQKQGLAILVWRLISNPAK